jgi:hypothetical protein
MQELLNSLVRFSAAVTVLGMQEVKNAAGLVSAKPSESLEKLKSTVDRLTDAVSSHIEDSAKPSVDNIAGMPHDFYARSEALGRDVLQNTSDLVKNTTDWLASKTKSTTAATESETSTTA